jgi:hypothetical protein
LNRPLTLLIGVLAVATAPIPTLAQTWPATVVAGAPQMAANGSPPALTIDRSVIVRRPTGTPPPQPRLRLRLQTLAPHAPLADVEIRPKADWLDDQGLRLTPTRVAFKRRF